MKMNEVNKYILLYKNIFVLMLNTLLWYFSSLFYISFIYLLYYFDSDLG